MTKTKPKRQGLNQMFSAVPSHHEEPARANAKRQDRIGKKALLVQLPETAKKQLAILAIEAEKTQQAVITEALNDLFVKYGKQPIA